MAFCSKIHLVANQCGNSSVVEHLLAKEGVASSNLVFRSIKIRAVADCNGLFCSGSAVLFFDRYRSMTGGFFIKSPSRLAFLPSLR